MIKKLQTGGTADQYQKAKKWTADYVNSPKYKERLTKQVNTEKMLDSGAQVASPTSLIKRRTDVLNYVKPEYVKGNIANTKGLLGDYSSADSILRVRTDLGDATPTLVHELSHATMDGDAPYSTKFNDSYVNKLMIQPGGNKFTNRWDPYIQKPIEIKGRLDSLRYQMKSKGIYDAGTQDFGPEHLQKMRADKDIANSEDFKSLEGQLPQNRKDYGMTWLMNNIAKNKQPTPTVQYAQLGGILSKLNPKNWGVSDYSDEKTFETAYSKAKRGGNEVFMYKNKRFSTDYAGTPFQEVSRYGVNGRAVDPKSAKEPIKVVKHDMFTQYTPGHISADVLTNGLSLDGEDRVSVSYGPKGNNGGGTGTGDGKGASVYNVYNASRPKLVAKANFLKDKKEWNLLTNNCADNVCDGLDIKRDILTTTPQSAVNKIKDRYPTLNVKGRTMIDYLWKKPARLAHYDEKGDYDKVLKGAKRTLYEYSSPEFDPELRNGVVSSIQRGLNAKGQKVDVDGFDGPNTQKALNNYIKGIKPNVK